MQKSEENISKELQFEIEKKHLRNVIEIIKEEILNYIDKRNNITEKLIEYRKNALDEYKDDEDKLIEYFDHERYAKEEAYKIIDKRLKEITVLQKVPYFGKIDLLDKEYKEEDKIYIGRFGLTKDGEYEPIVIDWRAPIASLFYEGKLGNAEYESPNGKVDVDILNKKQYVIKNEELLGMFDSVVDIKDEVLKMVLSKNVGEKLRDIIMTIQKEQDEIIRQSKDETVVVDGVAGSGKTTIALHRVAYLLYNHRKNLEDKVVIFGPNNIFMEYISRVLPSLGESGVKQSTFYDFAIEILNLKDVMDLSLYMEKIVTCDKEFIDEVLYKTSIDYKVKLDNLVEDMNDNFFVKRDVLLGNTIVVSKEDIKELFNTYYASMPLFKRSNKIRRIIFSKLKDKRDELVRDINKRYKESIEKLDKEKLELEGSFLDLKRKINIREVIKMVISAKKTLKWLNNPSCEEIYNKMNDNNELNIDDLAPILYLKIRLEGFKLRRDIKHIVIDEAQDYSALQFLVISELLNCKHFTIVGDSNQRIIPIKEDIPMNNLNLVLPNRDYKYFKLTKSYRSTKQIMDYANKYLEDSKIVPMVREGKPVVLKTYNDSEEFLEELLDKISELKDKNYESIAVICKDLSNTRRIFNILKDKIYIKLLDNEDIIYKGGIALMPSYFAKGLEFDGVIFIEDGENEKGDKIKYVMATRALHELIVLKEK
ncbi:HelD family protein [Haloimpatiens sp. FM7315]|uniref:HelD family protein n=1 Tax=Haloimpatiens sp. FM7315 TaxID=3298609 RepID=UPI00370C2372